MGRRSPRITREFLATRRGFVFAFFALALVILLGFTGLAIDTARGVVTKAEVSRVADAAALAAAKNVRRGVATAEEVGRAVAALNGIEPEANESLSLPPPVTNGRGETRIVVEAGRTIETTFMKVLGVSEMDIHSRAEATVPPLDLVLVIDQSGSMLNSPSGGRTPWQKLAPAAKRFVAQFSDEIDQLGVVHFSTMAEVALPLQRKFTRKAKQRIDAMEPSGDTNAEEGLSMGLRELTSNRAREAALKVVVFFTDGRPTAFRDNGREMGNKDGILTAKTRKKYGNNVLGWYSAPEDPPRSIRPDDPFQYAAKCLNVPACVIAGGETWRRSEVLDTAREKLLENAEAIRTSGIFIFSIGLGNLTGPSQEQPDQDLLRKIANADGTERGTRGGYVFAQSPDDLDTAFQTVAADILARLSE